MSDYVIGYLIVHGVLAVIGLFIELINVRYLLVKDFIYALIFGTFYFFACVSDMNRIVIDFRKVK